MSFLISNWKYVVMGVLLAASALFFKLWQNEVDEFNIFKAKIEVLGQEAERKKKETEAHHTKVLEDVKNEWESKLPKVREAAVDAYKRRYSGNGLRVGSSSCALPGPSGSTQGANAASKEPMASGACDESFIRDSAEDALHVNLWQKWARENNLQVR